MVERINYIFGSLQIPSDTVKNIRKIFRHQARFNRTLTAFALTMTIYALMVEIHNHEQNNKIEELNKEIKELKRTRGE
jgi:cell division protein FtsL